MKSYNTTILVLFPDGSNGKESACDAGDLGSIPILEDPLKKRMAAHSSILAWRISMDRGAWWATVHGVAKSWTQLCDFHFTIEYVTQHNVFNVHPCSSVCQNFIPSHGWIVFLYMDRPYYIHSFVDGPFPYCDVTRYIDLQVFICSSHCSRGVCTWKWKETYL